MKFCFVSAMPGGRKIWLKYGNFCRPINLLSFSLSFANVGGACSHLGATGPKVAGALAPPAPRLLCRPKRWYFVAVLRFVMKYNDVSFGVGESTQAVDGQETEESVVSETHNSTAL